MASSTAGKHLPGCVCERCFSTAVRGVQPPAERPLPATRQEYLADVDRAFNAGVKAGRERERRERARSGGRR